MPMDEFDGFRGPAPTKRATSFVQYDYYDFVKTPKLRAEDPVAEQAFLGTVWRFHSQLRQLRVLDGLQEAQQDELAALVADFTAKSEMYSGLKKVAETVAKRSRRGTP